MNTLNNHSKRLEGKGKPHKIYRKETMEIKAEVNK